MCQQSSDSDALHLAKVAQVISQHLFDEQEPFDGTFHEGCQAKCVLNTLLVLVGIILNGCSIKDQTCGPQVPAALAISQLLRFNSVKHTCQEPDLVTSVRNNINQETSPR